MPDFSSADIGQSLPHLDEGELEFVDGTRPIVAIEEPSQTRQATGLRPQISSTEVPKAKADSELPSPGVQSVDDDRVPPNFDELDIDWNS